MFILSMVCRSYLTSIIDIFEIFYGLQTIFRSRFIRIFFIYAHTSSRFVFLGAFVKLRNASIISVTSVCPSARKSRLPLDGISWNFGFHWTEFHEISASTGRNFMKFRLPLDGISLNFGFHWTEFHEISASTGRNFMKSRLPLDGISWNFGFHWTEFHEISASTGRNFMKFRLPLDGI